MSISSMAVGPSATGNTALMVLSTDQTCPTTRWSELRGTPGISDVHTGRVMTAALSAALS